jgi:signal transduction histidine kinase
MADAREADLSYGTYMVLGKPILFWLRWGGLLIAFFEVVAEAQMPPGAHQGRFDVLFWIRVAAAVAYGALFVKNVPLRVNLEPHRERWLLSQVVLGVFLSLDLTNLSTFCIPFCVPIDRRLRWCGIAIGANFAGWITRLVIYRNVMHPPLVQILHSALQMLLMLAVFLANYIWYGFAFLGACLLFELARRQQQLAVANEELVELQTEIQESAKYEERFRLSRELHDAAGHYLTSLSIQLEIAQHRTNQSALPAISRAQLIAKVLLAEIRESVSAWREDETGELVSALKRLLRDVSEIETHFESGGALSRILPTTTHGLYRCAQEAITNVLRHAEARNLWISLTQVDSVIRLEVKDDGRGCSQFKKGNGLNGIQSRVNEMHGTLHFPALATAGFAVAVTVPVGEGETA